MSEKKKSMEEDMYLDKRKLGELFDSSYPLEINLWRGQKPEESGQPILYPILKSFLLSNGKTRDPERFYRTPTGLNRVQLFSDSYWLCG